MNKEHALVLLHQMLGEDKEFRPDQWEAIEAVTFKKQRVLLVERTGWGKSLVYFIATKLLREGNAGPTLLISPLLSLMRNQLEMAQRIGIQAASINSDNIKDWAAIEETLASDKCDLLLISPERLNNPHFLKKVLPSISGRIGLFVVDEAHCISDWGHDFRPDYQRIVRIIRMFPRGVPVLGTTATANDRVVKDIQMQLGPDLHLYRGPLKRESLRLQNIRLKSQAERYAWLIENLPKFEGGGIIYCLTVADTEKIAGWLKQKGFSAEAYHANTDDRSALEDKFLHNEVNIMVATIALGMGFDKPDIHFVIHFQRPGSVIAYYQQVGRAGRAIQRSYGILLNGEEDDEIQNYFIDSAFPNQITFQQILQTLEKEKETTLDKILAQVNVSKQNAEKALKLLEVEGAIGYEKPNYFRTPNPWKPDLERINRVLKLRRDELDHMREYVDHKGCLMEFLLRALDDPKAAPCGQCANCKGRGLPKTISQSSFREAEEFLKDTEIINQPRKYWPRGYPVDQKIKIPKEFQNEPGRSLCYYGETGWGKLVIEGKYQKGHFSNDLVEAAFRLITEKWKPDPFPAWVTAIPSNRRPALVADFSRRLAIKLNLPFLPVFVRTIEAPEQKTQLNGALQAKNVYGSLSINCQVRKGVVLLVDDIIDSGWTLTAAGYLLRKKGGGLVYPFTLAKATGRNTNG